MSKIYVNPNFKKKLAASVLITTMLATTLTGCNKDVFDTQYVFNELVIVNGNVATIVEVKQWRDYEDGDQLQIITKDGLVFLVDAMNAYPLDTRTSEVTSEEFARNLVGENGEVKYLNSEDTISKTK